ncbi:indole-3-acetic acid-induced protein ARG7 [Brachypodium distachyon]|uniref:SAUR family protein n=1 Tax=Brachypodium distachyon TaxID=15368 RepID=I1J2Z0_BRADI|nr:indole-3-acetic acid-induced protein ARG7 [Brachypodium distachyon]KQJ85128.1 hypothetical protein BRADI_5g25000v3 [Brachypodium distachyon]|eukprot:XP_003580750.1 indole-3-acetic acid-induced protein ARG7 [Brachypodium distachyon]
MATTSCSRIRSIVRLQQTLRRWRSRARAASSSPSVPAGHVAVCVGAGVAARRFVVRAAHLNHPVFRELLRQAEEERGGFFPSSPGPLALPCCDEDRFRDALRRVAASSSSSSRGAERCRSFLCCRGGPVGGVGRDVAARPLLQGLAVEKMAW